MDDCTMKIRFLMLLMAGLGLAVACSGQKETGSVELQIPRGYQQILEITDGGQILSFGPFVGYYFKPPDPQDLTRLSLVCFNENQFYTKDLPENAKLFTGEAVFATLQEAGHPVSSDKRINPIFFSEAPAAWKASRPTPQDEFLHFHSCYDANGPVMSGFWVRHVGEASFTYDMGGRVSEEIGRAHV